MEKCMCLLVAFLAASQAGTFLPTTYVSRAPAFDSAFIKSDRLGGNFAYSVAENHAYATHTPVVQTVAAAPVTYAAGVPAVSYAAPAVTYAAQPAVYQAPFGYGLPAAYAAPTAHVARFL